MTSTTYVSCKICKLLEQDSDLWWEVHRRILDEKAAPFAVVNWLNERIKIKNSLLPEDKQIPLFNRMNIHNHFVKRLHVKDMAQARTLHESARARARRTCNPYEDISMAPVEDIEGEGHAHFTSDVSEFKRMRALIAATESRLYSFNSQMAKKEEKASKKGKALEVDLHEVARFQKLVSELLKLQKEAAKVEASSKIAGAALLDAMSLLVESMLTKVESASIEIHGILSREMPGSRLPDQVSALLRARIGDVIKLAIPQVIETVHKRYGIK